MLTNTIMCCHQGCKNINLSIISNYNYHVRNLISQLSLPVFLREFLIKTQSRVSFYFSLSFPRSGSSPPLINSSSRVLSLRVSVKKQINLRRVCVNEEKRRSDSERMLIAHACNHKEEISHSDGRYTL